MKISLLLLVFLAVAPVVPAATRTWVGQGVNNQFGTAANWQPAGVPQDGDILIIDATYAASSTVQNNLLDLDLKQLRLQRGIITGNTFTVSEGIDFEGGSNTKDIQCMVRLAAGPGRAVFDVTKSARLSGGVRLDERDLQIDIADDQDLTLTGEISGTGNVFAIGGVTTTPEYSYSTLTLATADLWNTTGKLTLDFVRCLVNEAQPRMTCDLQVGVPSGVHGARRGFLYPYKAIAAGNPILSYGGNVYANVDPQLPHSQRALECLAGETLATVKLAGPVTVRNNAGLTMRYCQLQENPTITTEATARLEIADLTNDNPNAATLLTLDFGGRVSGGGFNSPFDLVKGTLTVPETPTSAKITVRSGAVLEIAPTSSGTPPIGGLFTLDGGTLRLTGSAQLGFGSNQGIHFASNGTIDVPAVGDQFVINSNLTGPGTCILTGRGTVAFSDSSGVALSTYAGGTDLRIADFRDSASASRVRGPVTVGTPGSGSTVTCRAKLPGTVRLRTGTRLTYSSAELAETGGFIFEGSGQVSPSLKTGDIEVLGFNSNARIEGVVQIGNSVDIDQISSTLTLEGPLKRLNGFIDKRGPGLLRFTGSGAYSHQGPFLVTAGTVEFATPVGCGAAFDAAFDVSSGATLRVTGLPQFNPLVDVNVRNGGLFDASGITGNGPEVIDALTGPGLVIPPAAGLRIGEDDSDFTFPGVISGVGGLEKSGSGTAILTGNSTHLGLTRVIEGVLQIDGSLSDSTTEAAARGILRGNGQLQGLTVKAGGNVAPGASIGTLSATSLTFENGSRYSLELGGTNAAPTADRLAVSGPVTIQAGAVLALSGSVMPTVGSIFRPVDKTDSGAISGTFSVLAQGGAIQFNSVDYTASYTGGTGNDFTLTTISSPGSPANLTPVFPTPPVQNLEEGQTLSLNLAATDPDAGQVLTYEIVSGAPSKLTLNPSTGAVFWPTTETNGGSSFAAVIRVTDNGAPPLSSQTTLTINVAETNLAPAFNDPPAATALTVGAGGLLTFNVNATDADRPYQTLTYAFNTAVPAGMVIDNTGTVSWLTNEFDPAATIPIGVTATDNGTPSRSASTTFSITRTATLHDPLAVRKRVTVQRGQLLSVSLATTDPDTPPQPILYSQPADPPGVPITIDAAGLVTWQTAPNLTPGLYGPFRFLASHAGGNPVELVLRVNVDGENTAPRLRLVEDIALSPGTALSLTLRGTDADLPAQTLTYSLSGPNLPSGTVFSATTGVIHFQPSAADNLTVFPLTAQVTDDGIPPKSAIREFRVYIRSGTLPDNIPLTFEKRLNQPGFLLGFDLPAGLIYEVQSSDDLQGPWITRETGTSSAGPESYLANPSVPRRFFRLRVP